MRQGQREGEYVCVCMRVSIELNETLIHSEQRQRQNEKKKKRESIGMKWWMASAHKGYLTGKKKKKKKKIEKVTNKALNKNRSAYREI